MLAHNNSFRRKKPDCGKGGYLITQQRCLPRLGKESVSLLSFTSYNLHSNIIILSQQYGISPIQTTMSPPLEEPIHVPSAAAPSGPSKEGEHDAKPSDAERIPPLEAAKQIAPSEEAFDTIEVDSDVIVP
jgi:hypothetical protein